ncbi:hypothetical protein OG523_27370 [Streptomyces virginiae]|nr:hypothetical protein [Streptomyces virginiae]MCX4962558.1 hypothetical protein [Streptomyces virginiae]
MTPSPAATKPCSAIRSAATKPVRGRKPPAGAECIRVFSGRVSAAIHSSSASSAGRTSARPASRWPLGRAHVHPLVQQVVRGAAGGRLRGGVGDDGEVEVPGGEQGQVLGGGALGAGDGHAALTSRPDLADRDLSALRS